MTDHILSRRSFGLSVVELGLAGSARVSSLSEGSQAPPDPVVVVLPEMLPKPGLILVSDQQLLDLQDPDKRVDISLSASEQITTLRQMCQQTKAVRGKRIVLAFDEFWEQYRPGQRGK